MPQEATSVIEPNAENLECMLSEEVDVGLWKNFVNSSDDSIQTWHKSLEEPIAYRGRIQVCLSGGRIVGALFSYPRDGYLDLLDLEVLKDSRRRGVANRLLHDAARRNPGLGWRVLVGVQKEAGVFWGKVGDKVGKRISLLDDEVMLTVEEVKRYLKSSDGL